MFYIRAVREDDLEDLHELSKTVSFINLPDDRELIKRQIKSSVNSFIQPDPDKARNYFIFVLVDAEKDKIIGVSMIHGQHGTESEPHFFLKVGQEKKYSETISTGFIHGTLLLDFEPNGYTEIGGLVLEASYRGSKEKLGKQLSFVRFLYMAFNRDVFTKEIHSELMPPLDKDGNSPLWEAIGRRFMNMNYQDADVLSRSNKEFILSLYPSNLIYTTLLPIEARDAIGNVGKDTLPVKKMLESIGFKYVKEVDPFDGGPHYRAKLEDITLVKDSFSGNIRFSCNIPKQECKKLMIRFNTEEIPFGAVVLTGMVNDGKIEVSEDLSAYKEFFPDGDEVRGIYF